MILALLLASAGPWDALPWAGEEVVEVAAEAPAGTSGAGTAGPRRGPWGTWPTSPTATTPAPATTATTVPSTVPSTSSSAPGLRARPVPVTTVIPPPPVLAPPAPPPPPPAPTTVGSSTQQAMLAQVNVVRAAGRSCGGTHHAPVPGLRLSGALNQAATAHAIDMATRGYFDHTGADGSDAGSRMLRAGYAWSAWGENIAAGQPTGAAAVEGWFASPGHCANFMSPVFTEVGFGLADLPGSPYGTYWVAALASPR